MNRKNKIVIVTVLVVISLIIGFFVIPEPTDDYVNNTTLEDTNYDGIKQNGNTIQLNPDLIFEEHRKLLDQKHSYSISMTKSADSGKIRVDGNKISLRYYSDTERNKQMFYDGNYTYKRIGSLSNNVDYHVSNESLTKSRYYPMDDLESLISNSEVKKYNDKNNSLRIWMGSENNENIGNILNNSEFGDYRLYMNVSRSGLINFISIEYNNPKNTGLVRETRTYLVDTSIDLDLTYPHWKQKAVDINPEYFETNKKDEVELPPGMEEPAN